MGLLEEVKTGVDPNSPVMICIMSRPGMCKSTMAGDSPNHIIGNYDDGLGEIDCTQVPMMNKSLDDAMDLIKEIANLDPCPYEWFWIDSYDKLQQQAERDVCKEHGWSSIEEPGYGKGNKYVGEKVGRLTRAMKWASKKIYREQGKALNIGVTCHCQIRSVMEPHIGESYDLYTMKLNKHVSADLYEACDAVLFGTVKTVTRTKTGDFGKRTTQGIVTGERILYTSAMTGVDCKNRFGLPPEIPADMGNLLKLIKKSRTGE